MKILKKNIAYIIEIEQSEKETGRTMYNTRHELAKLITHKEKLQSNWNSLREYVEELYNKEGSWASCGARYILDKMNELESGEKN